ncbi:tyrosine--tRNA ligase [Thermoflavimicrobium dichotomicum]|uniref:Tyrosine--tRNA ligase n=1 Tax=Thermoflavimicrobium dichotomicum TaxID=46223 RepID=A0A1I3MM75_9BACL|nr:tyrosine--tRNA ligase [Thermoflavimicrobium dichotomicum]SFI98069.1 tyrosyl-tRNA synthetase [Thermoflavimicrobium dichotomicum]
MDILKDLQARGLIYQSTDLDALQDRLSKGPITLYCGFDPTADSLHIGHLVTVLTLRRFQLAGHHPIALVGGATGLIGDPSGRTSERTLNSREIVTEWTEKLKKQLSRFLDFESSSNPAKMVNNYDWIHSLDVITFLRDIGKNFTINSMLAKESVSSRLERGISFTEFSYMILQAYDFYQLHEKYQCELQVGGSDQWGNITAGTELIRRMHEEKVTVHGLTLPLITKSDGTKFGKSASGAVWLDPEKTSPYAFYQFLLNVDDHDVIKLLKVFTFLSLEEIKELEQEVATRPEKRVAQRTLAEEVTRLVHGEEALKRAVNITQALFHGEIRKLTAQEIAEAFQDVPSATITDHQLPLVDVLVQTGAAKSKREAREFITNGAVTVNDVKVTDLTIKVDELDHLAGKYLVIRRGKKNYYLCELAQA